MPNGPRRQAHSTGTEARHPSRRPQRCSEDEGAVSEIIGFVIVFGIIGTIILLATLAFANQRHDVDQRVVQLRSQSVAQRVAQVVYDVGNAVGAGTDVRGYNRTLELPSTLEGFAYTVNLRNTTLGWRVNVTVNGLRAFAEEPVANIGVGAPNFELCNHPVSGGLVRVRYGPQATSPNNAFSGAATCRTGAVTTNGQPDPFRLYLES